MLFEVIGDLKQDGLPKEGLGYVAVNKMCLTAKKISRYAYSLKQGF